MKILKCLPLALLFLFPLTKLFCQNMNPEIIRNIDWGKVSNLDDSFLDRIPNLIDQFVLEIELEDTEPDMSNLEIVIKRFSQAITKSEVEENPLFVGFLAYVGQLYCKINQGEWEMDWNDGYDGWEPFILSDEGATHFILKQFSAKSQIGYDFRWMIDRRPDPFPKMENLFSRVNSLGSSFPFYADSIESSFSTKIGISPGGQVISRAEKMERIDLLLDDLIYDKPDVTFEVVEPLILGIIALYGNALVRDIGMEWKMEYEEDYGGWLPYLKKENREVKISQMVINYFIKKMGRIVSGSNPCMLSLEYQSMMRDLELNLKD